MDGTYGNFFDRPSSIDFKSHVFFELRTTDRELLPIVLLSILTWMVKWFSLPHMQDKSKGIILDEAWAILEDPALVKFVEEAFRTYRKKGIFIMIASQFASDVSVGVGEIVKKSCPYQVFLYSQDADEVARLFDFTDAELQLLKQIRPPRDYEYKYSLLYMRTPYQTKAGKEQGLFFLIPSREFYWTATTHPQDRVKREQYKNFYKSLAKAIEVLAQEDLSH
jgi:type IV secretory pathway VirB4 component